MEKKKDIPFKYFFKMSDDVKKMRSIVEEVKNLARSIKSIKSKPMKLSDRVLYGTCDSKQDRSRYIPHHKPQRISKKVRVVEKNPDDLIGSPSCTHYHPSYDSILLITPQYSFGKSIVKETWIPTTSTSSALIKIEWEKVLRGRNF
jgi:hypothetical protein